MISNKNLKVTLVSLNCYETEETGYDDVFLMLDGKKIWPQNKKQHPVKIGTTSINVDLEDIKPGSNLDIEIWDYDVISANDLMGHIPLFVDEPGGPYLTDMIPDPEEAKLAKYTLEWEIDFNEPE